VYRECYAVAFREPRLAYASRSWCTTLVCREIISCNAESHTHQEQRPSAQTRAEGVSPPWFNQRRCERESFPRSAHADRSWRTTLRPGWRIAPSAMHKHMFTRTARVSPPWGRRAHFQPVAKVAGWLLASAARRGVDQRGCKGSFHGQLTSAVASAFVARWVLRQRIGLVQDIIHSIAYCCFGG
jgi:hypothetical protein